MTQAAFLAAWLLPHRILDTYNSHLNRAQEPVGIVPLTIPYTIDLSSRSAAIYLALLSLYVGWRLWKFSLKPWLYPDNPLELPYPIPCKRSNINISCLGPDRNSDIGISTFIAPDYLPNHLT